MSDIPTFPIEIGALRASTQLMSFLWGIRKKEFCKQLHNYKRWIIKYGDWTLRQKSFCQKSWSKINSSKITLSKISSSKITLSKITLSKINLSKISSSKISLSKINSSKIPSSKIPSSKKVDQKLPMVSICQKSLK